MNQEGFIVDACFDGSTTALKNARVIPTIITNGTGAIGSLSWNQTHGCPTLSSGAQALSTLQRLQNLSAPLGTTIEIDQNQMIGYVKLTSIIPPDDSYQCKRTKDLKGNSANDFSRKNIIIGVSVGVGSLLFYLLV